MNLDRRVIMSFDWAWFLALLGLVSMGLGAIWSTTQGSPLEPYFKRQIIALAIGLIAFLILLAFDYHLFSDYSAILYLGGIGLLVYVLLFGHTHHNSKSWIDLGSFNFQPSELVKFIVVIALAKYYSGIDREYLEVRELLIGGCIVLLPMVLTAMQGDLGTAVTFTPIFLALSFLGGLRRKYVLVIVLASLVAAPVAWMQLKTHQKDRFQTVINPANDPRHRGYQTIQSEIAIGSGRFMGKGFKQGSQGQLGFLPARQSDFIFAVLAEEKGFVGGTGLLSLLYFIAIRLLRTARESKDKIGALMTSGVLAVFLFHMVFNIGMVVGLLPIAGIPLPFVSAGGSSLISSFLAMSLCMGIRMHRYVN